MSRCAVITATFAPLCRAIAMRHPQWPGETRSHAEIEPLSAGNYRLIARYEGLSGEIVLELVSQDGSFAVSSIETPAGLDSVALRELREQFPDLVLLETPA